MEEIKEKPKLTILREMEVGEVRQFPAEEMNSIKSMCSAFGFQWGKRFATTTNREERTISVTRIE